MPPFTILRSHTADFHFLTMHIARTYRLWSELHIIRDLSRDLSLLFHHLHGPIHDPEISYSGFSFSNHAYCAHLQALVRITYNPGPLAVIYVFVGAIEITHDIVGATTIALDSIGATTIALGSIGATTTTLDLLSILSGSWAHYSRFCRGYHKTLPVQSGFLISTARRSVAFSLIMA